MKLVIHYVFVVSMAIIDTVVRSAVLANNEIHDLFAVYPVMRGVVRRRICRSARVRRINRWVANLGIEHATQ